MATDILERIGMEDPYEYNIKSFRVHVRGILESCSVLSSNEAVSEIVISGASITLSGAVPKGLLIGAEYIVYVDSKNVSFEMVQK